VVNTAASYLAATTELTNEEGVLLAAECIETCLPYAQDHDITLILENHYKDDFWLYPEFAQKMDVFCNLVNRIQHPYFGVNYDPSNAFLAGKIHWNYCIKFLIG
jgi:sugar phosphate isomerase/epimerase